MSVPLPAYTGDAVLSESRMHWLRVPFSFVVELYKAQTLRIQRNHVRRAQGAPHITEADSPMHSNYVAGRTADGKIRLVDGYTRITAVLTDTKAAPNEVWLGLVDCRSTLELESLYDAVDSRQSVKRGRDAFEEGLRRAGLLAKLKSPLFIKGQAVSAISAASGTADIRKGTWELRQGIQMLDSLNLGMTSPKLPAGALAALLLIAAHEKATEEVHQFAIGLMHPDSVPRNSRSAQSGALACAKELAVRREQGALSGRNVVPLMEMVLSGWVRQSQGAKVTAPGRISRLDYIASKA